MTFCVVSTYSEKMKVVINIELVSFPHVKEPEFVV